MKSIPWLGVMALVFVLTGCGDRVTVTGGAGAEDGLLADGASSGTFHNDDRYTGSDGSAIPVGPYDSGGGGSPGELIAFTSGRAPTLKTPVNWTSGDDQITFAFDPKYRVKFKVWVVQGPFADGQTKAINACIRTSQIWGDERQGTGFSAFDISDATANPKAGSYTAFTCGLVGGIKNDIGFDNAAVNIYWVNTVDFGNGPATSNGVWCGGNVLGMGWNTMDHLFSHEVGHAFTLDHVNSLTTFFDTTNVMHNASNARTYLTEGQTFRAVVNSNSVVTTLAGRTGTTRDTCDNSTSTPDPKCPAVQ